MKRTVSIIIAITLFAFTGLSQSSIEALRYSQSFALGTARSVGMGGAFGALGGDFSSLSINPAGIGVFREREISISPTFTFDRTTSSFLNNNNKDYKNNLTLNNLGVVITFPLGSGSNFINLGLGYNEMNDYNRNILIEGVNNESTLLDYFSYMGFNNTPDNLYAFEEGIAWDTWLINDTLFDGDIYYESVYSDYGNRPYVFGQNQRRIIKTRGNKGEYVISLGTNIKDFLYLGGTLGINKISYLEEIDHLEEDITGNVPDLNYFDFYQYWETRGTGYSFKLGAIVRPINMLRIGVAFHLPTIYKLSDEYYSYIEAEYDTPRPDDTTGITFYNAESPDGMFDYDLRSPFKFVGSVALQVKKLALVSMDYEYVNFSNAQLRFDPDYNYSEQLENQGISDQFKPTHNIRLGAEFRLGLFSLRGGYAYYGSPYDSGTLNEKSNHSFLSGGVGIRARKFYTDFAYQYAVHKEKYMMYNMIELEETSLSSYRNKFIITIGFRI